MYKPMFIKTFTIIETLVVLGSVAVIFSIGFTGFIRLQQSLELRNAVSDIRTALRTTQNYARNSVALNNQLGNTVVPVVPSLYAIYFTSDNYSIMSCDDNDSTVTCTSTIKDAKPSAFDDVSYTWQGSCPAIRGVAFSKSVGKMIAFQGGTVSSDTNSVIITNATKRTSGDCILHIIHAQTNTIQPITFDITNNNIVYDPDN